MKRVAVFAAGLALFATGFLAACGGEAAESPSNSDTGTATSVVLSGTLTVIDPVPTVPTIVTFPEDESTVTFTRTEDEP